MKTILLILGIIIVGGLWIHWSEARDKAVMSVHYCFAEQMDGSLYHYVCEENE